MTKDAARQFILDNSELDDRLAAVLIDRQARVVMQRIASAGQIATPECQVWLKTGNRSGRDVFVSMNSLAEQARGRTRGDVAVVSPPLSDFDENGTGGVQNLSSRENIPQPNHGS